MAGDGLTLLELCDVAYVLWTGQIERQYLVDRQAYLTAALQAGSQDVTPPSWEERQAGFDVWLASDGRPVEASMLEQLLGLAA